MRTLPDGEAKAEETRRMIDRVRTFAGYREYPKYAMVSRYFVYKQALMEEADRLVRARVLREREDIFYLRFQEIQGVVRTNQVDEQLIAERKNAFKSYRALTPPRVLTSDGECIAGSYRREDIGRIQAEGSCISNTAPCSEFPANANVPPCASAAHFAIERPSPAPPPSRDRASSTR